MSLIALDQELTFGPDATSQDSLAWFPDVLRGQYVEFTVYIQFSSGTSAGKVQIETAYKNDFAGTWGSVGSTIDWAAASSQKYASVTGVFGALRLRITAAVTGGTVKAFVIAAS